MINMQILQGKWDEVKGKLVERWGQLTNDDLTEFHGDSDQLIGLIHRKTGEGYEAIEKSLTEMGNNWSSVAGAVTDTVREYAGQAAKSVQQTAKQATDKAYTCCTETKRFVHDQPMKALAVFFGVGVFAGLMIALKHKNCSK
jgi:uncharacterized protein YjbJ (UPF0337 family)